MKFQHYDKGVFLMRRFVGPRTAGSWSLLDDGRVILHIDRADVLTKEGGTTMMLNTHQMIFTLAELNQLLQAGKMIQAVMEETVPALMRSEDG